MDDGWNFCKFAYIEVWADLELKRNFYTSATSDVLMNWLMISHPLFHMVLSHRKSTCKEAGKQSDAVN